MKLQSAFFGVLAALLSVTNSTQLATAAADNSRQIMEEVTYAEGGLAAARAIAALAYDLHIKEATYEADAHYVVDRAGRMRIDIYIKDKRVFTECFDGKHAWEMAADGVAKTTSAKGTAALWHGTQFPGQILTLAELPAHGHRVKLAGKESVGGVEYQVLELTMSDGFKTFRYVDPQTHLIKRGRDQRALHPDIDPKETILETTWDDYRPVDGVQRAFVSTQIDLRDSKWLQTTTVKSIRKLAALPDRLFVAGAPAESSL